MRKQPKINESNLQEFLAGNFNIYLTRHHNPCLSVIADFSDLSRIKKRESLFIWSFDRSFRASLTETSLSLAKWGSPGPGRLVPRGCCIRETSAQRALAEWAHRHLLAGRGNADIPALTSSRWGCCSGMGCGPGGPARLRPTQTADNPEPWVRSSAGSHPECTLKHVCILFRIFSHLGCYILLSWVPCSIQ